MDPFAAFKQALQESLNHLHNPLYHPADLMWPALGCQPQQGVKALQTAIVQTIENLKPPPGTPASSRWARFYSLLHYRYVQGLTQEATATQMGLTPRHLRREQDRAVESLAQQLWAQPLPDYDASDPDGWRLQVRQELATLQQNKVEAKSDVAAIIAGVEKVAQVLTQKRHIRLKVAPVPPQQIALIYPTSLRQVLLTAIEKLVQQMAAGEITFVTEQSHNEITITVTGSPSLTQTLPDSDLIQELLSPHQGGLSIYRVDDQLQFQIKLASANPAAQATPVSVLVVDDNVDLITFYQLYVTNTPYQISHLADGNALFETIATTKPDIIVLDVLLPDMDGWELLTYLHEHPDTRTIPIIICSVIRREDLALALGASLCLPKPVRRQTFIQALDQVYHQGPPTTGPTGPSHRATL